MIQPPPQPPIQVIRRQVLTRDTARLLLELAEADLQKTIVHLKAREIVKDLDPRTPTSEGIACLQWVRNHVRFTRDPDGFEFVILPAQLLGLIEKHGTFSEDCDSQTALLYDLLRSIGHCPAFAFVGFTESKKIDHVYIEDTIDDRTVALDPILPPHEVGRMLSLRKWKEIFSIY